MSKKHNYCPQCNFKFPGVFITKDNDAGAAYIYYACKNSKCLEVWRVNIIDMNKKES